MNDRNPTMPHRQRHDGAQQQLVAVRKVLGAAVQLQGRGDWGLNAAVPAREIKDRAPGKC